MRKSRHSNVNVCVARSLSGHHHAGGLREKYELALINAIAWCQPNPPPVSLAMCFNLITKREYLRCGHQLPVQKHYVG